jgi:RNA polymerase sigma-70 factor (ECF subfamily)
MSLPPDSIPPAAEPDAHARFMRLFLGSEKEIFRYVAVLVPRVADAQDVVQQTAIALWKKFEQYDATQPFTPWACRFALLEARQFLRRDQRWGTLIDDGLADALVERRAALNEEMDRRFSYLSDCLSKLAPEQRQTVERYYYERRPVEELAAQGGRSVEAIYKALQRIRQALFDCVTRALKAEGGAS